MSGFDSNTGALISADTAAGMLQAYMTAHGIDPNAPKPGEVYGYLFGLKKLKDLIKEIEAYNAGSKPEGEITGVRVYKCNNTYDEQAIEDVLIIPVIDADKDLYPIRTETSITQITPNIVLDNSIPCPSMCPK